MFTDRQRQILDLYVAGRTRRQIAEDCHVAYATVNATLRICARKLGTTKMARSELAARHQVDWSHTTCPTCGR